jgi:hypothetical protein
MRKRDRKKVAVHATGFTQREQLVFAAMVLIRRIENSAWHLDGVLDAAMHAAGYSKVVVQSSKVWEGGRK